MAHVDVASKRHLLEKSWWARAERAQPPLQGELEALKGGDVAAQPDACRAPSQTEQFLKGKKLTRLRIETDKVFGSIA